MSMKRTDSRGSAVGLEEVDNKPSVSVREERRERNRGSNEVSDGEEIARKVDNVSKNSM